jgi:hypothetical protein
VRSLIADGSLEASEHAGPSILAEHRPSNEPVQFGGAGRRRSFFGGFDAAQMLNHNNCRVMIICIKNCISFRPKPSPNTPSCASDAVATKKQNNCHPSRLRYVRRHAATSFMAAKR